MKKTLTVVETGRLLGLSRNATYDAIRRKEIPATRIGRRIIISAVALDQLLENAITKKEVTR